MNNNDRTAKLRIREKLGYSVGDFGFNLYWTTIASFLAAFYTDVFGISAAAAGTMFLVTKIFDACTDPLMGALADRTKTRFGKFRPYLLWAGLPMAGAAVLTFTTPNLNESGKILWAYGTYSLMMVMYTVLSTPYSALSGVMTARSQERTSLISMRFIFAYICVFFVNYKTLDFVSFFGGGDDQKGWQITMLVYGIAAALIFAISFISTKERIAPRPSQQTNPIEDIQDLIHNRPWVILFALALIISVTFTMRGGSAYYYFSYFLERPDLLGQYLGLQGIFYALGAASAPFMTRYLDKAKLLTLLMAIVGALSIVFYLIPKPEVNGVVTLNDPPQVLYADELLGQTITGEASYQWQIHEKSWWIFTKRVDIPGEQSEELTLEDSKGKQVSVVKTYIDGFSFDSGVVPIEIKLMFLLNILISFFLGPKSPLTWSMYADTADYNEWKTGRRATAMTFSAATFSQKIGGALGSAVMLWVLAYLGYEANQAQSGASQAGIVFLQTAAPGVFAIISVFVLRFYTLSGETLESVQNDLKARQANLEE